MAGSSNQYAYQLGQTLLVVGLSLPVQVMPPRGCNGIYAGWQSGGSLLVLNGIGSALATGSILGTTERLNIVGPATFFLAAAGSTATVSMIFSYSAGYSQLP
jgi:hypothetical protein